VNWEKIKKTAGWWAQLTPLPIHLDAHGRVLPVRNEDWIIQPVTDTFNFPSASGLQARLEAAGYWVHWSADRYVRTREFEAWEVVREPDRHGVLQSFRWPARDGDLTLMKLRGGR
jgi:hypothetical protein